MWNGEIEFDDIIKIFKLFSIILCYFDPSFHPFIPVLSTSRLDMGQKAAHLDTSIG